MEESSTLTLEIEKGPRSGEILEFTSRSTVRIGRVVRGNTITIKDPGISSKHLSIKFDLAISSWTLSDLDSSNGTFLNDTQLTPNTVHDLTNGDTIKLGEITSIKVTIQNPGEVLENNEVEKPKRRGRPKRECSREVEVIEVSESVGEIEAKKGGEVGTRRTRGAKMAKNVNLASLEDGGKGKLVGARRTRGARMDKNENLVSLEDGEKGRFVSDDVGVKGKAVSTRSTRSSRMDANADLAPQNDENVNLVPLEDGEKGKVVGTRRTRSSRRDGNVDLLSLEDAEKRRFVGDVVVKEKAVSTRSIRSSRMDANADLAPENDENGQIASENVQLKKGKGVSTRMIRSSRIDKNSSSVVDDRQVEGNNEVVKESILNEQSELMIQVGDDYGEEIDMERMTLGDWFDYLEVALPRQIYDATDKVILEMGQTAKKHHEFRLQQNNNASAKGPIC